MCDTQKTNFIVTFSAFFHTNRTKKERNEKMRFVYFKENNDILLCQVLERVPYVDDHIKLKGRKGKVLRVEEHENKTDVFVQLEKKVKQQQLFVDKRKRR